MVRRILFSVMLALAAGAAPLPAQADRPDAVLRPGDAVRINVWRKPEMSGEFVVGGDGTLVHPLYRQVRVSGVPLATAEGSLRDFLTRYESAPQFAFEPLFRVFVGGEVRQPNLYLMRPETTLAQGVALAGGVSERGRLSRVRLVRDGRATVIDLTAAGDSAAQMPVRSGDQITVPRRSDILRDYVMPIASVTAAVATVVNLVRVQRAEPSP